MCQAVDPRELFQRIAAPRQIRFWKIISRPEVAIDVRRSLRRYAVAKRASMSREKGSRRHRRSVQPNDREQKVIRA
jgi:hypothetical protein